MHLCKSVYAHMHTHSIVLFDRVYISDVVPKTFYDKVKESYFVSVTVCLHVVSEPSKPLQVNVEAKTNASHDQFDVKGVSEVLGIVS